MKKKIVFISIAVSVFLVLLVLFFPTIPQGPQYLDGGTKEYKALTYRVVVWNRYFSDYNPDGSVNDSGFYHKTSVFWFPDNFKEISELWEMECLSLEWSSRERAKETAIKECKVDYDYIFTRFVESDKSWQVEFCELDTGTSAQTVTVDFEGNVVSDSYAE